MNKKILSVVLTIVCLSYPITSVASELQREEIRNTIYSEEGQLVAENVTSILEEMKPNRVYGATKENYEVAQLWNELKNDNMINIVNGKLAVDDEVKSENFQETLETWNMLLI